MSNVQSFPVLNNATNFNGQPFAWPGGTGLLVAVGGFGGGTLQVQVQGPDGSTWVNLGSSISSAGTQSFTAPAGIPIRVLQAGATTPSVVATLYQTPTLCIVG